MKNDAAVLDLQRSPKYLQVVNSVISDIEGGALRIGDRLPSINEACVEWYLSKDSVKRAYETLYRLGIITSVYRKGYFIADRARRRTIRLLVVTGQLTDSVKQLHDVVTGLMGREVLIDVCTYNHRQELFHQMIDKQLGNYHYFLLMPNLIDDDPEALRSLLKIPSHQLILLGNQWRGRLPHGFQIRYGGEHALYNNLESRLSCLRKYTQLNLILSDHDVLDPDYIRALDRFCTDYDLNFQILDELTADEVQPLQAYFVADGRSLVSLVDHAQRAALQPGRDLGIISFIENDYTRLLAGGVSVIAPPTTEAGALITQILRGSVDSTEPFALPLQLTFRASC